MRIRRMAVLVLWWSVSLLISDSSGAAPICEGGVQLDNYASKRILLAQDTLFFKTSDIQLDIDGSPSAYGVQDQGFEDICNGLGPLQPPQCRGKVQGPCYAACQAAFRNWNGDLQTLGQRMCSIGLGGGGCSTPNVRLQQPPRQQWFVSETTVRVVPPSGISVAAWIKTQPAQLDSTEIPYFVISGGFRRQPWDATPGDAGVVVEQTTGKQVAFIVGDVGGSLNEGSAKLLAELAGINTLPARAKTNAFGVLVQRLQGAKNGDFRVAIFRHTAPLLPSEQRGQASVLNQTAENLPAWIRDTVHERIQSIGGPTRVIGCTSP